MYCLSVVYISVISFSDTGEETQQSSPVASRNRFCPWGLRCSLHVERSPRFSITHVYYVRVLVMSPRNDLHTPLTKAVRVTSSVSNPDYVSLISMPLLSTDSLLSFAGQHTTL